MLRYMTLPKTLIWRSAEATKDHPLDSGKDAAGGAEPDDDNEDEVEEAVDDQPASHLAVIAAVPEKGGVRT